jgi:hypothetical protein
MRAFDTHALDTTRPEGERRTDDPARFHPCDGGPAPVYLSACGVLCDIFWWARPGAAAKQEGSR